jgi:hypothetical protein
VRILVCGSRTYPVDFLLPAVLDAYRAGAGDLVIIDGGARGADTHAHDWAVRRGVRSDRWRADWDTHGKAAGPIRNQRMLDEGEPDLVLAFVDKPLAESKGTADMVHRARKANVPTYVIEASA